MLSISLFWLVLSVLFDGINTLLLPERLLQSGGTQPQASTLGLLSFFGLLAGMLIQPVAGAWSDRLRPRWGRKGVLAVGTLLVLGALAIFGFSPGLLGLAVGYIFIQISASIVQAAQQGFIPDQVPAKERGLASGVKNFMDIGGAMVGFVLLGKILGEGQPELAALVIGGMMIAALVLTFLLVHEPRQRDMQVVLSARPGLRVDLRQHPQFFWLVLSRFFFLLGTYAVGRFLLLFVASRLGLSPANASSTAGSLLAGLALVTVITAPLAGWAADRVGRTHLMLFGALISAAGTIGYIFASSLNQIFGFGCLLALGSGAFASANWAMTADVVPKDEAARYFGIANFGTAGSAAAAGLFGLLVDSVNHSTPGRGFSALFIAATLAFVVCAISLRGLRSSTMAQEMIEFPVTSARPDNLNPRVMVELQTESPRREDEIKSTDGGS